MIKKEYEENDEEGERERRWWAPEGGRARV